jgi:hypothetical protein
MGVLVRCDHLSGFRVPRFDGSGAKSQAFRGLAIAGVLLKELTHGARAVIREPSIRQALVMSMVGAVAGACAIVVTIAYVRDLLGRSDTAFTIVMAGVGIGSSMAAVVLSRVTAKLEQKAKDPAPLHRLRHRWASHAVLMGGAVATASLLPGMFKPPIFVFGRYGSQMVPRRLLSKSPQLRWLPTYFGRRTRASVCSAVRHHARLLAIYISGNRVSGAGDRRR